MSDLPPSKGALVTIRLNNPEPGEFPQPLQVGFGHADQWVSGADRALNPGLTLRDE
jgi:hypothetical protein